MIFTVTLTNRRTGNTKVTEKHGINEAMLRHALEGAWPGYDIDIRRATTRVADGRGGWVPSAGHGPVA